MNRYRLDQKTKRFFVGDRIKHVSGAWVYTGTIENIDKNIYWIIWDWSADPRQTNIRSYMSAKDMTHE